MVFTKLFKAALSLTVAASMLSWSTSVATGFDALAADTAKVANPIIWSDVPDNDVIRVGDTYYMISTTMFFSPGAPIMKSKDLLSWEICSYVYDTLSDGDKQTLKGGEHDYAHGQWAASLRYNNGSFYVFFGSYGTGKSYIYKTNDIENGNWTRSEIPGMYHDASILFDDDGRNYLVYGGGGEIKIKELNAEMTGFKFGGTEKTLFKTGLDNLAGEGSHVHKIGDYYYVFVIAWPSTSGRIELCYRSRDLLGNYEGKTVLNSGVGTYGSGVAQGGVIDTPDGKWYAMLFQDHGAVGRIPVLVPVTWEDGWPIMGVGGKVPVTLATEDDYAGTFLAADDDFTYSSDKLSLLWQWNHNPDNSAWSVTERPGFLRLKNKTLATNLLNARNTLTQRTEGPACSSVIKLDTRNMNKGDYAGLSAFQYNYGNVGVYVDDNGNKKIYMAENGIVSSNGDVKDSFNKIVEETNLFGDDIYLKVDFKFSNVDENLSASYNIDKANFYYSYDGSDWKKIGKELSMTYDLKLFTGYRSAIYSYATKTTGGYADIDFFDYERSDWNSPIETEIKPNDFGWYYSHSFENNNEDVVGRGSAVVESSEDNAYVGSHSLYVSERTSAWNGVIKKLSTKAFKPGEEYSFSAHVKYTEGSPYDNFFLKLEYKGADGETHYSTIAESMAIKNEWVQLVNTNYMIPEDASDMSIYVETEDSTVSFYVDEMIGAVGGTGIAGEGELNITFGDVNGDGIINIFDLAEAKAGINYGFDNPKKKASADLDKSGITDKNDLIIMQKHISAISPYIEKKEEEKTETE